MCLVMSVTTVGHFPTITLLSTLVGTCLLHICCHCICGMCYVSSCVCVCVCVRVRVCVAIVCALKPGADLDDQIDGNHRS